jgi:hypothetical protein
MKPLNFYGGEGYDHIVEDGEFEVRVKDVERKTFYKLSDARLYYDSINEEKSLWQINNLSKLLQAHTI